VDALLDRLGARFGIGSDAERAAGTLRCLSEDAPVAVDLLADLLRRPALPEDKVAYVRKAERESILRQKDQPAWVATTLFQHELYGDHPFGRIVGLADLDAVGRADLERRHARTYVPERTLIGVAGDFERDAMLALLTAAFGDWARGASELPAAPPVDPAAAAASCLPPGHPRRRSASPRGRARPCGQFALG
jgi:zinc protease